MARGSSSISNIYGPGLAHRLQAQARGENGPPNLAAMEDEDDDPTHVAKGGSQHMTMSLKRRRQSTLLKEILKSGGYGDLAKMSSFHKG